ncbi:GrpB protein [Oceanobacillus limi]|uniref:GrpB protein n=1 Tax=Oceanobacillus limi TaxID=930131 RepID=A0A1I0G2K9_9BACI|nr:GrpB family protein [Oceanobacillus limi]SET64839.1 GrpB protein [Oceanobacillus limi]
MEKTIFQRERNVTIHHWRKHKGHQHFGSTAIEGINAKPIIDILVGVESLDEVEKFDKERLKENGYYHLSKVSLEGKVVFAKFSNLDNLTKTHIMHIVKHNCTWWKEHTYFRDYLNEHPEKAREYEALKKRLALKYPNEDVHTPKKRRSLLMIY